MGWPSPAAGCLWELLSPTVNGWVGPHALCWFSRCLCHPGLPEVYHGRRRCCSGPWSQSLRSVMVVAVVTVVVCCRQTPQLRHKSHVSRHGRCGARHGFGHVPMGSQLFLLLCHPPAYVMCSRHLSSSLSLSTTSLSRALSCQRSLVTWGSGSLSMVRVKQSLRAAASPCLAHWS